MMNTPEDDTGRPALDAVGRLAVLVAQGLRRTEISETASNPMTGKRDWADRSTVPTREQVATALCDAADEVERIPGALRDSGSGRVPLSVWTQTIFQGFSGKFLSPGWLAVGATADALSGGYYLCQAFDAYRAGQFDLALAYAQNGVDRLTPR